MASSQFYRDVSKVEKKIWGISIRQLKAGFLLFLVAAVLMLEIFLLPTWIFNLVSIPTAFLLGIYPTYLLLNKWKDKKRDIELYFIYEDRFYTTGQIRRYEKNEFIQDKNVKETDPI